MSSTETVDRQAAHVMHLLSEPVERALRDGADPDKLAATLIAAMPSRFGKYGPFYDTAGLTSWLGISRQALAKRAANHKLLAVRTSDRQTLYPVWQFDRATRAVPAALQAVLAVLLPAVVDPWTAAMWLRTPLEPGGKDAVQLIAEGGTDEVLTDARRDAARWVQ